MVKSIQTNVIDERRGVVIRENVLILGKNIKFPFKISQCIESQKCASLDSRKNAMSCRQYPSLLHHSRNTMSGFEKHRIFFWIFIILLKFEFFDWFDINFDWNTCQITIFHRTEWIHRVERKMETRHRRSNSHWWHEAEYEIHGWRQIILKTKLGKFATFWRGELQFTSKLERQGTSYYLFISMRLKSYIYTTVRGSKERNRTRWFYNKDAINSVVQTNLASLQKKTRKKILQKINSGSFKYFIMFDRKKMISRNG